MAFSTTPTVLGPVLDFSQGAQDSPQQIEAGDFNGDGKLDFLVTRIKGEGNTAAGFRIMLGQGNGQWVDGTQSMFSGAIPTVEYAPRVVVADFNGDGRSDVYVPNFGPHNSAFGGGRDQVWLSGAGGKLALASTGTTVGLSHGVTFGDIDRDGDLDVVVDDVTVPTFGPRADRILINNGQGAFTDNQALLPPSLRSTDPAHLSHTWSLLADVTGDGALDLILGTWESANSSKPNTSPPSQVLVNNGSGSFANSPVYLLPQTPVTPESVVDIDAVDFTGDGLNDLIVTVTRGGDGSTGQYYGTGYVQFLANKGGGQFVDETALRYPAQAANTPGAWWKFTRVVDFNHDGAPDLLLTGAGFGAFQYNQSARVLMNDGKGHFTESLTLPAGGTGGVTGDATTAADVNGDGYADLVGLQWTSANSLSLVAFLNTGAPAPAATPTYTGKRADYTVAKIGAGLTVTPKAGGAAETFANVERVKFSDKTVNLTVGDAARSVTTGQLDSLIELYIAYVNRVPDADGMAFWIGQLKAGQSLNQIGEAFYGAALQFSSLTGYSAGMSSADFVKVVYKNVLGRSTPDAEGLAYWSGALDSGSQSRGNLVGAMLGSAHTFKGKADFGYVADLLDNKISVGKQFAITNGLVYNTSEDSISQGMAIAAAVTPTDKTAAISLIGVTDGLSLY